jgi:hypothetical protein
MDGAKHEPSCAIFFAGEKCDCAQKDQSGDEASEPAESEADIRRAIEKLADRLGARGNLGRE